MQSVEDLRTNMINGDDVADDGGDDEEDDDDDGVQNKSQQSKSQMMYRYFIRFITDIITSQLGGGWERLLTL